MLYKDNMKINRHSIQQQINIHTNFNFDGSLRCASGLDECSIHLHWKTGADFWWLGTFPVTSAI